MNAYKFVLKELEKPFQEPLTAKHGNGTTMPKYTATDGKRKATIDTKNRRWAYPRLLKKLGFEVKRVKDNPKPDLDKYQLKLFPDG